MFKATAYALLMCRTAFYSFSVLTELVAALPFRFLNRFRYSFRYTAPLAIRIPSSREVIQIFLFTLAIKSVTL